MIGGECGPDMGMADERIEIVVQAISGPCGRCNGKGIERHQVSRDVRDGYKDWPCPSCRGVGSTVLHASPEQIATWALDALDRAGAGLTNNTGSPNGLQRET